jgi:hypothetical protein
MPVQTRSDLRGQIDAILSCTFTGGGENDPLIEKVRGLVEQAYAGCEEEEWNDIAARIRKSFGLADDGLVRGGRGDPIPNATRHEDFPTLIPDGWFHDYLDWTNELEAPPQFRFGAAITIVAAGLCRRPRLRWEARDLYPNLYTLLVGPTGSRKGSAVERAMRTIVPAMGANILPNEGTHQGFAHALRRRLVATSGATSDGLIVAPEFSVLMSRDRNKEDLVRWLTDWYDSPAKWERGLRGEEEYELRNVYVCVLGGSIIEWLRTMPVDAITGGFMPRFVLFDAPDKQFWKARPRVDGKREKELQHRLSVVASAVPEEIGFDSDGERYIDHWYEVEVRGAYERSGDERYRAWLARKQAAALKLAIVWQLADGGPQDVLAREWIEKARRVVDWGDSSVAAIYGALGVTQEGQVTEDVLRVIARSPGKRCSRRTLVATLDAQYQGSRVGGALNTLILGGKVKRVREVVGGTLFAVVEGGG